MQKQHIWEHSQEPQLQSKVLKGWLYCYPDRRAADSLMTAFTEGVHINYKGPNVSTYSDNMKSAYEHRDAMWAKIQHELEEGRVEAIETKSIPSVENKPLWCGP